MLIWDILNSENIKIKTNTGNVLSISLKLNLEIAVNCFEKRYDLLDLHWKISNVVYKI